MNFEEPYMSENAFVFDKFPRADLRFPISRRQFWKSIFANWEVFRGKGRGGQAFTLASLGSLPDEQLGTFRPVMVPGCRLSMHDDFVWGQPPTAQRPHKLFPPDSPALTAFNLFNGRLTLGEVSRRMAEQMHWEPAYSFAYTRGVFLTLVQAGICQPQF
jgi:hypothetical protein